MDKKGNTVSTTVEFIDSLLKDLETNSLVLPVLPDVALKVHKLLNNPQASVTDVAKALGMDAAISARIIQVANSPIFRGQDPIEDLNTAIIRMGQSLVRSLVTVMLVEQSHRPKSPLLRQRTSRLWKHNTQVAALSYVLARNHTFLKPDEAMLAGLIHDIGVLPILEHALQFPEIINDQDALDEALKETHTIIGKRILEIWKFPEAFILTAAEHENLGRESANTPELIDVVTVANLHSTVTVCGPRSKVNWGEISAFKTLKLTPEESVNTLKQAASEIRDILHFFRA